MVWKKMVIPIQKVWSRVSKKFGIEKTGIIELHKEVRTCEYEDVQILWELLTQNEADRSRSRKGHSWKFHLAQCSSLLRRC